MNREQLWGAGRGVLSVALGIAVGRGWLKADDATAVLTHLDTLIPAIGALAVIVFGIWKRRDVGLAQAAGKVQGVVVAVQPHAAPALQAAAASSAPADTGVLPVAEVKA